MVNKVFNIFGILLSITIVLSCCYALTAGLLDKPPTMSKPSEKCNNKCIFKANIPNKCPKDALNCEE